MSSAVSLNKIYLWYLILFLKNDIIISEKDGGAVYGYLSESTGN